MPVTGWPEHGKQKEALTPDKRSPETAAPDTFFILVGTNDLLSDGNNGTLNDRLSAVTQNPLGDGDTMVAWRNRQ